tara:strand:- start:116 stop:253 length:138 start_codon:yes stop_codon:yes gene_type:complete
MGDKKKGSIYAIIWGIFWVRGLMLSLALGRRAPLALTVLAVPLSL